MQYILNIIRWMECDKKLRTGDIGGRVYGRIKYFNPHKPKDGYRIFEKNFKIQLLFGDNVGDP